MKKKIAVLMIISLLSVVFIACGSDDSQKSVVGVWDSDGNSTDISDIVLNSDGTGRMTVGGKVSLDVTYTTEGDKLILKMTVLGKEQTKEYTYSLSKKSDELTLKRGDDTVVLKKKN